MPMHHDGVGNLPQAMPYVENLIDLTEGTIGNVRLIRCKEDGSITITFSTGNTVTTEMEYGEDRSLPKGSTVTIVEGTYDFG